jgi:hypothetical protein
MMECVCQTEDSRTRSSWTVKGVRRESVPNCSFDEAAN